MYVYVCVCVCVCVCVHMCKRPFSLHFSKMADKQDTLKYKHGNMANQFILLGASPTLAIQLTSGLYVYVSIYVYVRRCPPKPPTHVHMDLWF